MGVDATFNSCKRLTPTAQFLLKRIKSSDTSEDIGSPIVIMSFAQYAEGRSVCSVMQMMLQEAMQCAIAEAGSETDHMQPLLAEATYVLVLLSRGVLQCVDFATSL